MYCNVFHVSFNGREFFHSNPQDRAVLKMMTSIRSALSSVSMMFTSGKLSICETLLKSAIKSAIRDKKLTRMPENLVEILKDGMSQGETCGEKRDAVWHLRRALDAVYDEYVDMYCGVQNPRFNPVHRTISNVISLSVALEGKKNTEHLKDLYLKTAKAIAGLDTISIESKKVLNQAEQSAISDTVTDVPAQVACLRKALDFVYDEVRLPEIHGKPEFLLNKSTKPKTCKEEVLLDFTGKSTALLNFTPKILNDTIMGGKSTSEFKLQAEEAIFEGAVSTERDGGFSSVKFHPDSVESLRKALLGCIGIKIVAKNLLDKVQRFKIQLASLKRMRAFNYQSEIVLPPKSDYTPVFLHTSTFWPTMFGHVLANQGEIDVNAVDTVGILVSKLSDDGKPNPDFIEGQFSLAVKCMRLVY